MPYYPELNILFIHIPKTGGTVIEKSMKKMTKQNLFSLYPSNKILKHPYNNVSLQHQYYTTLYTYRNLLNIRFDDTIKIFSVVRNPYDRIISDLFWNDLIKPYFTSEQVFHVIQNKYLNRNDLDNHNKPQYKFVTDDDCNLIPNIKIFRCEELNEKNDEINKYFNIDINIVQSNVNKDYSKYLNAKSIILINNYYKKDFELFDYPMKIVQPHLLLPNKKKKQPIIAKKQGAHTNAFGNFLFKGVK